MSDEEPGAENVEAELEELRERTAYLEQELEATKREKHHRVRSTIAVLLVVIAGILTPLAVVTPWARSELLNTDRFVATFGPLADDPAVQNAAAVAVTDAIWEQADVEDQVRDVLPDRAKVLASPISNGVKSFTLDQAKKVMASEQFRDLWKKALTVAHKQVVALLRNEKSGAITIRGGKVILDLNDAAEIVVKRLADAGVSFVDKIPVDKIKGEVVLVDSKALADARRATSLFVAISWLLPILTLGLFGAAIATAPDRRRGVMWSAIALFIGSVSVGVALGLGRTLYLDAIKNTGRTGEVAAIVFDQVVRRLRDIVRLVAAIGLVAAAIAFFTGPSRAAAEARRFFTRASEWVSGKVHPQNETVRTVLAWIHAHRRGLMIAFVTVGAFWLLLIADPLTGARVIWTTLLVLIAIGIVSLLARMGSNLPPPSAGGDDAPNGPDESSDAPTPAAT